MKKLIFLLATLACVGVFAQQVPDSIKDDEDRECYRIGFKPNTQEFTLCKYQLVTDKREYKRRVAELEYAIAAQAEIRRKQAAEALMFRGLDMIQGK